MAAKPAPESRKLTNKQLAILVGVPLMTLHYYRRKGKIPLRPEDGNYSEDEVSALKAVINKIKIEATKNRRAAVILGSSPAAIEKRKATIAAKVKGILPVRVAEIVGVHYSTLFKWWRAKQIPPRLPDGSVSEEDIAAIKEFAAIDKSPEGRSERTAKGWSQARRDKQRDDAKARFDDETRANLAKGLPAARKALTDPQVNERWRANLSLASQKSWDNAPQERHDAVSEQFKNLWAKRLPDDYPNKPPIWSIVGLQFLAADEPSNRSVATLLDNLGVKCPYGPRDGGGKRGETRWLAFSETRAGEVFFNRIRNWIDKPGE